jgi:hypothetical protein
LRILTVEHDNSGLHSAATGSGAASVLMLLDIPFISFVYAQYSDLQRFRVKIFSRYNNCATRERCQEVSKAQYAIVDSGIECGRSPNLMHILGGMGLSWKRFAYMSLSSLLGVIFIRTILNYFH